MSAKMTKPTPPIAGGARLPPVRVKLRRINADRAIAYPPDGETRAWWDKLKIALGTSSSAFVNSSLIQLQAAARLPFGPISEIALNAALAMIEAAAPKNEIEGALAIQLACTHMAVMAVLGRLGGGHGSERRVVAFGSAAARLLKAYATQVEVLRRHRHGGRQYVCVEHVHLYEGGQGVVSAAGDPAAPVKANEHRRNGADRSLQQASPGPALQD